MKNVGIITPLRHSHHHTWFWNSGLVQPSQTGTKQFGGCVKRLEISWQLDMKTKEQTACAISKSLSMLYTQNEEENNLQQVAWHTRIVTLTRVTEFVHRMDTFLAWFLRDVLRICGDIRVHRKGSFTNQRPNDEREFMLTGQWKHMGRCRQAWLCCMPLDEREGGREG